MKSTNQELERLFASARQAPVLDSVGELPFGFATRVLSRAKDKKDDFLAQASQIVRWGIGAGVAVIAAAAVFSFSDPGPQAFASMEFAVQHEFTQLVLQR